MSRHTIHFDGAVGHHDLKDFYFDLQGTADHLLAYDFPQLEPGSTIGGTIWADGQTVECTQCGRHYNLKAEGAPSDDLPDGKNLLQYRIMNTAEYIEVHN